MGSRRRLTAISSLSAAAQLREFGADAFVLLITRAQAESASVARGVIEVVPGLGFFPGVIVDQHFVRRERHNRLLAVILERPTFLGVGIDESTAPRRSPLGATDVRLHPLPAGATMEIAKGRVSLPN